MRVRRRCLSAPGPRLDGREIRDEPETRSWLLSWRDLLGVAEPACARQANLCCARETDAARRRPDVSPIPADMGETKVMGQPIIEAIGGQTNGLKSCIEVQRASPEEDNGVVDQNGQTESEGGGEDEEENNGQAGQFGGFGGDEDIDNDSNSSAQGHRCVVVKYLRRSVMADRKKFARGAADLVIEASLLSALKHPNIIRLLGVTEGPVEDNVANGKDHGFFLVLDRLYNTLDHKMSEWKESQAKYSGLMFRATHDPRGKIRRAALLERLQIARSLADAVRYLHEHNVAFRDLVSFLCLKVYCIIFLGVHPVLTSCTPSIIISICCTYRNRRTLASPKMEF